ncbi:hypothetical protein [Laspinema palackyanum]
MFTFLVIPRYINYTSGPLPLARGGLGWGSRYVAIPYGIAPLTAT